MFCTTGSPRVDRAIQRNKQSSAAACISDMACVDTRNRLARRPELTNRKKNPRGKACLAWCTRCCAATAHRTMEDDGHGGGVEFTIIRPEIAICNTSFVHFVGDELY